MGSEETRKASILVYRHRHGEDISLHDTPEIALRAAGAIITDYYRDDDADARRDILAMIAAGNFEEALDAWNDGQLSSSDPERIEISEDVAIQAEAADKAEIDPEKAGDTLVRIWKMCEESGDSNTTLAEISRILAELDSAPTGLRGALKRGTYAGEDIFDDVIAAMQNAEEAGGPEGDSYLDLMERIAKEAKQRADNYRAQIGAKLAPMCPKCTSTGTDDIEIRETYSAYHPVVEVTDGKLTVRNALVTGCPSEHFDDGRSDYVATCRSCLHEGTPASFGLGDPDEWEWV